ncbi:hypothetical protein PVAG01_07038 [Phlyctema vagabunda]|uniref:Uncharacterized protein n=1 Tax=Phlyctema vagabunda TaxID=108571 RepID=A0ABR4PBD3_9HELO
MDVCTYLKPAWTGTGTWTRTRVGYQILLAYSTQTNKKIKTKVSRTYACTYVYVCIHAQYNNSTYVHIQVDRRSTSPIQSNPIPSKSNPATAHTYMLETSSPDQY